MRKLGRNEAMESYWKLKADPARYAAYLVKKQLYEKARKAKLLKAAADAKKRKKQKPKRC